VLPEAGAGAAGDVYANVVLYFADVQLCDMIMILPMFRSEIASLKWTLTLRSANVPPTTGDADAM
jgi:N-methylhydantoinase B/oxoprolinase/acetone carboxylase alpha subunit